MKQGYNKKQQKLQQSTNYGISLLKRNKVSKQDKRNVNFIQKIEN